MKSFLILVAVLIISVPEVSSNGRQNTLSVYLDCSECNMNYLRSTLNSISYVRDRKVAAMQIIVTDQRNASGGELFTFQFFGLQPYNESISFELETTIKANDTEQEIQEVILDLIKSGIAPYIANYAEQQPSSENDLENASVIDGWDYWVFEVSSELELEGESLKREVELENEFDVKRITENWRIMGEINYEYQENKITRDEGSFSSTLEIYGASASAVKSLGSHFSAGMFARHWSNNVNNIKTAYKLDAAFEYSFFPYEITYRKELTLAYKFGTNTFNYVDETIYGFNKEVLYNQSVQLSLDIIQPWGGIRAEVEGFAYVSDFEKNRLESEVRVSTRLVKGLFLNVSAEFDLIHDQIYLPKGDTPIEEVLLNRKALATSFDYELGIGVSYQFGSIYNNIVNTRL